MPTSKNAAPSPPLVARTGGHSDKISGYYHAFLAYILAKICMWWQKIFPPSHRSSPPLPNTVLPEEGQRIPDSSSTNPIASKPIEIPEGKLKPVPLFALLIGINKYARTYNLYGAVADALDMKDFLENTVGVESDHIKVLLDEQASRSAIISALQSLACDPRIQKGDALVIFFAGHGVCIPREAPRYQATVTQDTNYEDIHPIPDFTLGELLWMLYQQKGDNITVIFDSCHSGSGTRLGDSAIRCVDPPEDYELPNELDADLMVSGRRAVDLIETPFSLDSHVLLSACKSTEKANERDGRGKFTVALIQLLGSPETKLNQLTYTDIINQLNLKIEGQNPQCEGTHRRRTIFGNTILQTEHTFHVKVSNEECVLLGGQIGGVADEARFDLYSRRGLIRRGKPSASAVVQTVGTFHSPLRLLDHTQESFSDGQHLFAVQTKAGHMEEPKLYLGPGAGTEVVRQALFDLRLEGTNVAFSLVEDRSDAHLELAVVEGQGSPALTLKILDATITDHGLCDIGQHVKCNIADIKHLLQRAAHFFYHLHSAFSDPLFEDNVSMEIKELEGSGDNLLKDKKLVLEINRHNQVHYGVCISNNSDRDLYVHAFYFDCSALSIAHYYGTGPSLQFSLESPLKAHSELTLGYGSGGARKLRFYTPPSQELDVGFLKFVLSTTPVNLAHIASTNPFQELNTDHSRGTERAVEFVDTNEPAPREPADQRDILFTLLVPIVLSLSSPVQ